MQINKEQESRQNTYILVPALTSITCVVLVNSLFIESDSWIEMEYFEQLPVGL